MLIETFLFLDILSIVILLFIERITP